MTFVSTADAVGWQLVAETAGHPLPTQMVAGGVSIEKMLQKPVCSCFPVHLPPMHHVSRHPHAGVVVQPTRPHQLIAEPIHTGQPRGAVTHIRRQLLGVTPSCVAGFGILLILVDPFTQIQPHPLPEVAPTQFVDQLAAFVPVADFLKHRIPDLRQCEHAVADVRGKSRDGAIDVIAAFGVASRIHPGQSGFRSLAPTSNGTEGSLRFREFLRQQLLKRITTGERSGKIAGGRGVLDGGHRPVQMWSRDLGGG